MTASTFDTLAYVRKLRDAGVDPKIAEAQAVALSEVLKDTAGELTTKMDLEQLEKTLRADIDRLQLTTKTDLEQREKTLRADIDRLQGAFRTDMARLEGRFDTLEERIKGRFTLLQWMMGFNLALMVAVLWMLFRLLSE